MDQVEEDLVQIVELDQLADVFEVAERKAPEYDYELVGQVEEARVVVYYDGCFVGRSRVVGIAVVVIRLAVSVAVVVVDQLDQTFYDVVFEIDRFEFVVADDQIFYLGKIKKNIQF